MVWLGPFSNKKYNTELKPCPFCSSQAILRETFGRLVVSCENSKCVRPDTYLTGPKTTDLRVIAKFWNRRIPDDYKNEIEKSFSEAVDVMVDENVATS